MKDVQILNQHESKKGLLNILRQHTHTWVQFGWGLGRADVSCKCGASMTILYPVENKERLIPKLYLI
jgi:hypothetical protein